MLHILSNFHTNRCQRYIGTTLNETISLCSPIKTHVPKVSVLGPPKFLIYSNGITDGSTSEDDPIASSESLNRDLKTD